MSTWVCEDPDVIELVTYARWALEILRDGYGWDDDEALELERAIDRIPIPEEES